MQKNTFRFIYLSTFCFKLLITSLWGRSALDKLSEFMLGTMVITDYMLRYHTGEFGKYFLEWKLFLKR